jgi:hypothetical protein
VTRKIIVWRDKKKGIELALSLGLAAGNEQSMSRWRKTTPLARTKIGMKKRMPLWSIRTSPTKKIKEKESKQVHMRDDDNLEMI